MNCTVAVTGLQQSMQQAESEFSVLAGQLKEKRAEIRRLQKAICALTGNTMRTRQRKVSADPMAVKPETVLAT